jgi:hypothetical protein
MSELAGGSDYLELTLFDNGFGGETGQGYFCPERVFGKDLERVILDFSVGT